ncbi:hypothetical protein F5884DRAFT_901460 [Xylogone sp. PMI_703]|nr:hypothetical protein F5884DRAFT_901460 [Xylogone sp. PMI_703]
MAGAVGKVQAALAVATQETTLALANLNFDFSLVKVEAPVEFHGLGSALSTKRRNNSESGDHHRTARKLGSLFETILPDTPNLLKAYGLRVSEIANAASATSKGTKFYGPFADYAGVDGTNIWAAATSGNAAIAVHLLACMLARIWKAPEAISVWEQIVAARKQELAQFDDTGSIHIQSLVTSQLTLSRDQLSEWDASARAWLRTADEVMTLKQKQLMLIVENVNIPVNKDMDVYTSVINAWKVAMTTMDKLVQGMGHSVREGCVLLGLAAWHIYPDMIALGTSSTEIKQKDPLVNPGGIITFGLQGITPESTGGVYWSLPLAYVRYYGDPVQSEGYISSDSSRVSMSQFALVILGALYTHWGVDGSAIKDAARFIRSAWKCFLKGLRTLPQSSKKEEIAQTHWLKLMADAAEELLTTKGPDQELCRRLVALGQKRCLLLNRPVEYLTPMLGLEEDSYVRLLKDPELKIKFLRDVATQFQVEPDTLIIRVQVSNSDNTKSYVYLTAIPSSDPYTYSTKNSEWLFQRWVIGEDVAPSEREHLGRSREDLILIPEVSADDTFENMPDVNWFRWHNPPAFFKDPPMVSIDEEPDEESEGDGFSGIFGGWNPFSRAKTTVPSTEEPVITFEPIFGDPQVAAIFRRTDRPDVVPQWNMITLEKVSNAFHNDLIDHETFVKHMAQLQEKGAAAPAAPLDSSDPEKILLACLKSFETAAVIYKQLHGATISLNVISNGALSLTHWAMKTDPFVGDENEESVIRQLSSSLSMATASRPVTFSCITFFESGGFDIDPSHLTSVMAISSGNSIYVAAPILCDPSIEPASYGVQRIIGNVGRSGIAFLYPPENPKIKEWDLGFYQVVKHEKFDGRLDDCFQSTTLHLAFSGYELPIDVGIHGGRFTEAFFLEAVVSVHERGEWVADLDVLSTFDNPLFYSLVDQAACKDKTPVPIPKFSVVTVDSWKELIDRPTQVAVLRAHGNWIARLAAASLSVRLGIETVVFGETCCWTCGQNMLAQIQAKTTSNIEMYPRNNVVFIL